MANITIGNVAELTGVSRQTIRHYEKEGLLPEPDRTPSNYRVYTSDVIDRLIFIVHLKNWGFSLEEIRDLLVLQDGASDRAEARRIARENLEKIDRQKHRLERVGKVLSEALANLDGHGDMKEGVPLVETVANAA